MTATYRNDIIRIMKRYPDGVDAGTIGKELGKPDRSIYKALQRTAGAYIDRWANMNKRQYVAIWCLVEVPEDCPHPTRSKPVKPRKIETVWRTA